jgi:hypothetical protein
MAPHAAPRAPLIRNSGFEMDMPAERRCAPAWDCTMHNNPQAFRFFLDEQGVPEGRRSLCVERVVDEPWALVTQAFHDPALRGARVRLSAMVRVDGASGNGAGPWILAQANPPAHAARLVRGSSGWQRVEVDLAVPAHASTVEVGATLEGPGRACFDDVRLEIRP